MKTCQTVGKAYIGIVQEILVVVSLSCAIQVLVVLGEALCDSIGCVWRAQALPLGLSMIGKCDEQCLPFRGRKKYLQALCFYTSRVTFLSQGKTKPSQPRAAGGEAAA